jgi:hypothetical protein
MHGNYNEKACRSQPSGERKYSLGEEATDRLGSRKNLFDDLRNVGKRPLAVADER